MGLMCVRDASKPELLSFGARTTQFTAHNQVSYLQRLTLKQRAKLLQTRNVVVSRSHSPDTHAEIGRRLQSGADDFQRAENLLGDQVWNPRNRNFYIHRRVLRRRTQRSGLSEIPSKSVALQKTIECRAIDAGESSRA